MTVLQKCSYVTKIPKNNRTVGGGVLYKTFLRGMPHIILVVSIRIIFIARVKIIFIHLYSPYGRTTEKKMKNKIKIEQHN